MWSIHLNTDKSGIEVSQAPSLVDFILKECPNISFTGLMTIGAYDFDLSQGVNPDFVSLIKCKEDVCTSLHLNPDGVELSMGMSSDFEHAVWIPFLINSHKQFEWSQLYL